MRGRIVAFLLLAAGTAAVVWTGLGWPPPRLLLRYGLPPAGGPTGQTRAVGIKEIRDDGEGNEFRAEVEFVELAPGYALLDAHSMLCLAGDPLGRIALALRLEAGLPPHHGREPCRRWIVRADSIWMARTPVYPSDVEELADEVDPDRDGGLLAALDLLTRTREGRYRLAAQDEYTLACLWNAIESEGVETGERRGTGGERIERELFSPTLEEVFISGPVLCRVVWTPDTADR